MTDRTKTEACERAASLPQRMRDILLQSGTSIFPGAGFIASEEDCRLAERYPDLIVRANRMRWFLTALGKEVRAALGEETAHARPKPDAAWHTVMVPDARGMPQVRRVGPEHRVEGVVLEVPHGVPVIVRHLHPDAGTPARVVWVDGSVVSAEA